MPRARVWNDNSYPYQEVFKGEKIYIPAKSYIEMDEDEAHQFRGTYSPPKLNVDGVHLPEGFKIIRVERLSGEAVVAPKIDELQCLACKYKGSNPADLEEHLKTHKSQAVVDEAAEEELKARKKAKGAA